MSWQALEYAFDQIERHQNLKPCSTVTLLVLAKMHFHPTGRCDPAVVTIAKKGAISERSVQDALAQLSDLKIIKIIYRQQKSGKGKKNLTNRYKFPDHMGAKFASTHGAKSAPINVTNHPSAFDDLAFIIENPNDYEAGHE